MRIIYFDSYTLVLDDSEKDKLHLTEESINNIKSNSNYKVIYLNIITHSSFMNRKIFAIPIIRLFGTTCRGQKCCINIHNVSYSYKLKIKN